MSDQWTYQGKIINDPDELLDDLDVYGLTVITNTYNDRVYIGTTSMVSDDRIKSLDEHDQFFGLDQRLQKDVRQLGREWFTREFYSFHGSLDGAHTAKMALLHEIRDAGIPDYNDDVPRQADPNRPSLKDRITPPWIYEGEPIKSVDQMPIRAKSFVYLIKNLQTGHHYIGKKSLYTGRGKLKKETDWRQYYGSSVHLQADIDRIGQRWFRREIIVFCESDKQATDVEAMLIEDQQAHKSPEFYNRVLPSRPEV